MRYDYLKIKAKNSLIFKTSAPRKATSFNPPRGRDKKKPSYSGWFLFILPLPAESHTPSPQTIPLIRYQGDSPNARAKQYANFNCQVKTLQHSPGIRRMPYTPYFALPIPSHKLPSGTHRVAPDTHGVRALPAESHPGSCFRTQLVRAAALPQPLLPPFNIR